jgi:hypothetical protein
MNRQECPVCGSTVGETARWCGACGAHLETSDAARLSGILADPLLPAALRAGIVARFEARDAPIGVVIIGDRGRGQATLQAQLAGQQVLSGIHMQASPPLDEPAGEMEMSRLLCAAHLVVVCATALQLLGEPEQVRIGAALAASGAPAALVVGRMEACEDAEDRTLIVARAAEFAEKMGIPVYYQAQGEEAPAGLLRWLVVAAGAPETRERADQQLRNEINLGLACLPPAAEAPLQRALTALHERHQTAFSVARGHLVGEMDHLRGEWPGRLRAMEPERRRHEGLRELVGSVEDAFRTSHARYRELLLDGLGSLTFGDRLIEEGELGVGLGESLPPLSAPPPLPRRNEQVNPPLLVAAALLTFGVLLLPVARIGVVATGAGLAVGSYIAARIFRGKAEDELVDAQEAQVVGWLVQTEVEVRAALENAMMADKLAIEERMRNLAGAVGSPEVDAARARLEAVLLAITPMEAPEPQQAPHAADLPPDPSVDSPNEVAEEVLEGELCGEEGEVVGPTEADLEEAVES